MPNFTIHRMMTNRAAANLSLKVLAPASHSTDTYGKHRLKLKRFYTQKYQACQMSVVAATPKADAISVAAPVLSTCPTEITGEPMHDTFALRRLVTPAANDCRNLIADGQDMMARLSAPLAPSSARGPFAVPADLEADAVPLLRASVERPSAEILLLRSRQPALSAKVKAFLEQPEVHKSRIWKQVFGAYPTRGAVVRAAAIFQARLHASLGWYNYAGARDFRHTVRLLVRWYRPGRRQVRWRRGICRNQRSGPQVTGVRSAVTKKVKAHFARLRKKLRVEGMMQWRKVLARAAESPHRAGHTSCLAQDWLEPLACR